MLAKLKSIAKAIVGFLGVLIVMANQVLALGGVIPPTLAIYISAFVAVATPVVAYFAPYAPAKAQRRPRTTKRRRPTKPTTPAA